MCDLTRKPALVTGASGGISADAAQVWVAKQQPPGILLACPPPDSYHLHVIGGMLSARWLRLLWKWGTRLMLRSILLAALVMFAPIAAHSATVTFKYTAAGTFGNPDATVTGTFGYDLSAVDTDSRPDVGIYEGGFLTAKVTGGVQDGGVLSSTDVNFVINSLSFITIAAFVDNSGGFAELQTSSQPPLLSSDALPDATQTLALFNPADPVLIVSDFSLGLSSSVQTGGSTATYRLTSVTQVPLPAGGLLLLSALAGVGLVARRRRRPA